MTKKLMSWGLYPNYPQNSQACLWRSDLANEMSYLKKQRGHFLPFGNGLSYGDSCLASSDHVLHTRNLDRFIDADWEKGMILAEAGMTLEEVLIYSIPKGWFLPVTPGTKFVTLGGALANDVHGKNHHVRGTFGCHVPRFGLIRSDGTRLTCSATENKEFYSATIGGLGLTGIIEWVELKLRPIVSSNIDVNYIRFESLSDFFALSQEHDLNHEYSVSWIDCLAKGRATGRGVFMLGDHAKKGALKFENKSKIKIPITPPFSLINKLTLKLFNSAFYRSHKRDSQKTTVSYEPYFYPLDRILDWNRIYGPRGFQQYQCVIPGEDGEAAIRELLNTISKAGCGSFLAVLKRFGKVSSPGLLSFPKPGVTLALDFPQSENLTQKLFPRLDDIVRDAKGRLYPAKDAHMSGADFRQFFPEWQQLEKMRDPGLESRFWKRVTSI